jgi:pimeloyl-ACP methyl ester carboxylesterase
MQASHENKPAQGIASAKETFEKDTLTSPDGMAVSMYHGRPSSKMRHRNFPVLMLHGLGASRHHFHLDSQYSLAQKAIDRGFHVFMPELPSTCRPKKLPSDKTTPCGFKHWLDEDLTTISTFMEKSCSTTRFHGVGHSLGGMLLYAYAQRFTKSLCSLTTLASPSLRALAPSPFQRRIVAWAAKLNPTQTRGVIPAKTAMHHVQGIGRWTQKLLEPWVFDNQRVDGNVIKALLQRGISNIPLRVLVEIAQQLHTPNPEGPLAHEFNFSRIRAPLLAIAGTCDTLAQPASIRCVVESLKGTEGRYREVGLAFGDTQDYGHNDLLLGTHAPENIYDPVLDFIEEHDKNHSTAA